jgi:predicted DNA-binding protein (UPF0251 family)
MRARELSSVMETNEKGPSLRAINRTKRKERRLRADFEERKPLCMLMYGNREFALRDLELERMRLELEQLKAETAQIRNDTNQKSTNAVVDMARHATADAASHKKKVNTSAMDALRRNKS